MTRKKPKKSRGQAPAELARGLFDAFELEGEDAPSAPAPPREAPAELEEGVRLEDVAPRPREAPAGAYAVERDEGGRATRLTWSSRAAPVEAVEAVEVPLAVRELRAFPVAMFLELPLGSALRFHADGLPFVASTSKAAHGRALEEGVPAFAGGELRALALAARNDRIFGRELRAELERKRRDPKPRSTPRALLDGVTLEGADPLEGFTFRELEERLDVELVAVEID